MAGGSGPEKTDPPPAPEPAPAEDDGFDPEAVPPQGLTEEDLPSDEDEARMLALARVRQRRDNPDLVKLTDDIGRRVRKKD